MGDDCNSRVHLSVWRYCINVNTLGRRSFYPDRNTVSETHSVPFRDAMMAVALSQENIVPVCSHWNRMSLVLSNDYSEACIKISSEIHITPDSFSKVKCKMLSFFNDSRRKSGSVTQIQVVCARADELSVSNYRQNSNLLDLPIQAV